MSIKVLGPLAVLDGEVPLKLPGRRGQVVLASLAMRPDSVVSSEALIDAVWEDAPPVTAVTQIHGCISVLRRVLESAGHPGAIERVGDGYRLVVESHDLDLLDFQQRVAQSRRDDPRGAQVALGEALDVWRGPALSGLRSSAVRRLADVLDEERLAAQERWLELTMALGDHATVAAEARRLAGEHPLRESLHALLARALYAADRQGDALAVLRGLRSRLVEELGVEPSPGVRAVEQQILTHELLETPPIGVDRADASHGAAASADSPSSPPPSMPTSRRVTEPPRQLPRAVGDFVGRRAELERIHGIFGRDINPGALRVVGIHGPGGIGKSTLAVRVTHEVAGQFPDGQLYLDLDDAQAEDRAHILLGRALRALGVDSNAIPGDTDERTELYRSLLADRRILLLLDGVRSEDQVLPLLPGSSSCAVILTTRVLLGLLDGVDWVELEELDDEDSLTLLSEIMGPDRVNRELDSSRELVRYAGGLPLALRIAGARLASRPRWQVAELTRRMVNESRRLDEFSHRGRELRAGLASSYRSVPAGAKRLFRLASMVDGPSMPSWLAPVLLDCPPDEAEVHLEALYDVHLVQVRDPDFEGTGMRFGFHPLVRSFAAELLAQDDEREAALRRVLGAWLRLLDAAHRAEFGGDYYTVRGTTPRYHVPRELISAVTANPQAWTDGDHEDMIRAVRAAATAQLSEPCWEIVAALALVLERRGHRDDWADTATVALEECLRAGNKLGEAAMRMSLFKHAVRFSLESGQSERTLRLFEELGHTHGKGLFLIEMAYGAPHDDVETRHELARQALEVLRSVDDPVAQASAAAVIARDYFVRGEMEEAVALLEESRDLFRRVGFGTGIVQMEIRLAEVELSRSRPQDALLLLQRVRAFTIESRDPVGQAHAERWLGVALEQLGEHSAAEQAFTSCLRIAEELGLRHLQSALAQVGHFDEVKAAR